MSYLSFDFGKDVETPDSSSLSSDFTMANACAKEIADFLKKNAKGHHDSSDDEEEDEDDEEDEEDEEGSSDDDDSSNSDSDSSE